MKNENINFTQLAKFQSKQLEAWYSLFKYKYLLYGGSAGGGKSYFLRWAAVGLGMYYAAKYKINGVPIGLFSEDYPTLKDRQVRRMKLEMPAWLGSLQDTKDEGLVFKARPEWGGFVILLRNLDDPSKYASAEFAAVLVEELTKNTRDTFDDLRFRLRYPGIPDPKFVAATNPGSIGHAWVKKLWIAPDPNYPDIEQDSFIYVPARVEDNQYIDKSYRTQLESLPEQKRKAFLEGSWDIFAGQVFGEWGEKHVIDPFPIPDHWNRYMTLDPGYNAPFSLNWYAIDEDQHIYKYREVYMNGDDFLSKYGHPLTSTRLAELILKINQESSDTYICCYSGPDLWNKDLSAGGAKDGVTEGESAAETMIRLGIKLEKAPSGPSYRYNKLQRYRELLADGHDGKPRYRVFKTCYDTIRTIPALVYDDNRVEDVDTHGEDHIYDADCNLFMSRPSPAMGLTDPKTLVSRVYEQKLRRYNQSGYE